MPKCVVIVSPVPHWTLEQVGSILWGLLQALASAEHPLGIFKINAG